MNVLGVSATHKFDISELGHGLFGPNRGDIRKYKLKKTGELDRDGWY